MRPYKNEEELLNFMPLGASPALILCVRRVRLIHQTVRLDSVSCRRDMACHVPTKTNFIKSYRWNTTYK